MRALRIKQVADKIGLGQSTIYRMIAEGRFPKPFEIAPKRNAWLEEDVDARLAEKAGKAPPIELSRQIAQLACGSTVAVCPLQCRAYSCISLRRRASTSPRL